MLKKIEWNDFITVTSPHPYVLLVTSAHEKINLTGISWYSPVSWNPPMIMLSIRKNRYGYELLKRNPEFVIAFPSEEMKESAPMCGEKSGRHVDKVREGGFEFEKAEKVSTPLLKNSTACIECIIKNEIKAGDHQLVVADVLACHGDKELPFHIYTTSYSTFYTLNPKIDEILPK